MLVSPVDEPLINLVTEAERVVFDAEICDHLQLVSGEDLQNEDGNDCNTRSAVPPPPPTPHMFNRGWRDGCSCILTFPIGLLGVLMIMAFVLELNLPASSSGSRTQSALVLELFPDF